MEDKPSKEFTPEQASLRPIYHRTFEKHHLDICEFERQYLRFAKYRKYSGIPDDYLKLSFENMISDPEQKEYVEAAKGFLDSTAKFSYIYSQASGNGKTRLATNINRQFYYTYIVEPDRVWIYDKYIPSAYFMASSEYVRYVQLFKGNYMSVVDLNLKLSELDFLIIDDMYTDLMTSAKDMLEYSYDLFDMCITGRGRNKNFKLLWTSNKKASEIGNGDNRMASRIRKKNVLLISMEKYTKDWRDWRTLEK